MTKQIISLILMSALLLGVSSCSKNVQTDIGQTDKGTLVVNFGFSQKAASKAPVSTALPVTTWANNVSSLNILFVRNGNIVDNRSITVPADDDNGVKSSILSGIPVGNYEIYLIANLGKTANPFSTAAGTTASPAIAPGMSGPIANVLINMVTAAAVSGQNEVPGSTTYKEASEIFIANGSANIVADQTTTTFTLALTRAVSLMRVRINLNGDYAQNSTLVSFTDPAAALRIRRHGISLNAAAGTVNPADRDVQDVLLSNKVFQNANPATGYVPADMGLTGGFTLWNDYMILPGGSASTSSSKFNIVLTGKAAAGYIGLNPDGSIASPAGAGGAVVHWTGAISEVVAANDILEVNITLNSPGIVDPDVPESLDYGKLDLQVGLIEWGIINSTELPL